MADEKKVVTNEEKVSYFCQKCRDLGKKNFNW